MKREENKQALLAVRVGVIECLGGDDSGHGMDHIDRVERLTVRFCDEFKGEVDPFVARLIALLHDVDDYKLVGHTNAARLSNATAIMTTAGIGGVTQKRVLSAIKTIGYSKSLRGIRPTTVEGKIVSDADMCDAIGANGVMRSLLYAVSPKGNGRIFDPSVWPDVAIGADTYNADGNTCSHSEHRSQARQRRLYCHKWETSTVPNYIRAIRTGWLLSLLEIFLV